MNVLLISEIYLPTVSGVASSTDSIARFMAQRGHHVYLICPRPMAPYDAHPPKGMDIIYTPRLRDPILVNKPMTFFPLGLFEIWRTIATKKIDVVHIQEPGALGITTLLLAKLYRLPIVGAMHFSMEQVIRMTPKAVQFLSVPFMTLYVRMVYPQYTAIMMPTKTVTKDLAALIGHPERIHAISNGVDTTVYTSHTGSYAGLRKKYHLSEKQIYYLYLGRLDADKNIDTTLRALQHTSKDIHLIIAGVGTERKSLEDLAKTLSVSERIIWVEQVPLAEILDLYHLSDGFIIMSTVETQSIVALQAIACGLSLIVADAGALPELVRDGESGYVLPSFDDKKLAEKMIFLATHPDVRRSMGKASRELSLAHQKPTVLKKLEMLYEQVKKASV